MEERSAATKIIHHRLYRVARHVSLGNLMYGILYDSRAYIIVEVLSGPGVNGGYLVSTHRYKTALGPGGGFPGIEERPFMLRPEDLEEIESPPTVSEETAMNDIHGDHPDGSAYCAS